MKTVALLESEFMGYWGKLNQDEKESLLTVAKNDVQLRGEIDDTDTLRKKLIRQEREKYLKGEGVSYTWDEIKEMALNKEKRHAL
jgi:hypothetical protein